MTRRQRSHLARQRVAEKLDHIADTLDDPPAPRSISQSEVERAALNQTRAALATINKAGAAAFAELTQEDRLNVAG